MYRACADSTEINAHVIHAVVPVMKKYGVPETLLAYTSLIRGHDTNVTQNQTDAYYSAKSELKNIKVGEYNITDNIWTRGLDT